MKRVSHSHHNLDFAILKLLAINDELLKNDKESFEKLCRNVSKFLKHQVLEIDFSMNINVLTFKKHYRHFVAHLSRTRIHTKNLL